VRSDLISGGQIAWDHTQPNGYMVDSMKPNRIHFHQNKYGAIEGWAQPKHLCPICMYERIVEGRKRTYLRLRKYLRIDNVGRLKGLLRRTA